MARKRKLRPIEKEAEPEPEPEPEPSEEEEESEEEPEELESESEEEEEESEEEPEESESESEEEEVESEEEPEDLLNRETLRTLLEPLGKDQLIDLLKEAAARNPSLLSRISDSAESDSAHRKIFVHGIAWDCTTDTLTAAFSPFGDIEESRVVPDRTTGRSKGYGFVLFRTRRGARNALKEPQKFIGGRPISCELASNDYSPVADGVGRRLFVGNVGASVNPEKLKAFFARFGEIEEGPFGYDQMSGKLRGYAIFVYKMAEGCKKALEEPVKVFEGCTLQCRRAREGMKQKVPAATTMPAAMTMPAPAPATDLALTYASTYGNPAGGLVGQGMGVQSGGVGLLNPVAGVLPPVNRTVTPTSYGAGPGVLSGGVGLLNPVAGVSPSVNRTVTPTTYGAGPGVNTVSPSVIGSYQSQAALQGFGGYLSQSTMNPGMRSQSSLGSSGFGLPSYLGR